MIAIYDVDKLNTMIYNVADDAMDMVCRRIDNFDQIRAGVSILSVFKDDYAFLIRDVLIDIK